MSTLALADSHRIVRAAVMKGEGQEEAVRGKTPFDGKMSDTDERRGEREASDCYVCFAGEWQLLIFVARRLALRLGRLLLLRHWRRHWQSEERE